MLHRIRQRYVQSSTAICNQIRAYLRENGIYLDTRIQTLLKEIPGVLEEAENELSVLAREVIRQLFDDLLELRRRVATINQKLDNWMANHDDCQRLKQVPGFGPIVTTALVAAVGNGGQFSKGRQMSAWAGLTPRHTGTGGKVTVLNSTNMGNAYLRYLLIHAARTVVTWVKDKQDPLSCWIRSMLERRGKHKTYVALANKLTRAAWRILQGEENYDVRKIAA